MAGSCDIGLIGLAVMGQNLILNMADHGYSVAAHNRTTSKVDEFLAGPAAGRSIVGARSPADLVALLRRPRRVMLMVKAGAPVDSTIEQVAPLLDPGDIVIDGGNSLHLDTDRRLHELDAKGILFLGTGISGGEEGARYGPSMMPGGAVEAWPHVKEIFQAIAAKVGPDDDIPCCEWIGPGGSGHYVKMVHNGIEYGDMQLIAEAYHLLREAAGLDNDALHDVFDTWNRGKLDSYLIEITRDIFTVEDDRTDGRLVDAVLDRAGQKGTGRWTAESALDLGVPTSLITEAVYARGLSAMKESRVRASRVLRGPEGAVERFRESVDRAAFVDAVRDALYASKIVSYAQGFVQLRAASDRYGWDLRPGEIALLWRGGCIIRAAFLDRIEEAYRRDGRLENLLLDEHFRAEIDAAQAGWRRVVATAAEIGVGVPAFASALAYYDGYRNERMPHNLLQAQRDYFGAHTYERTDAEGSFHTDWLGLRRAPTEQRDDG